MFRNEAIPSQSSMATAPVWADHEDIWLQVGILVSSMVFLAVGPQNFGLKDRELIYPFCVLLLLHLGWALWSWKRFYGTLFHPYPLLFLSAFLFTAGQSALVVFGLNPSG